MACTAYSLMGGVTVLNEPTTFRISLSKKNKIIFLGLTGFFAVTAILCLVLWLFYPELWNICLLYFAISALFIVAGLRAVTGTVKVYDSFLKINFAFSCINKKIRTDQISCAEFVSAQDRILRAQPAYGDMENTLKITYSDIHYEKDLQFYLSLENADIFLRMIKQDNM